MKIHKFVVFLFQAVTVGLALAFVLLLMKPELLNEGKQVVQIIEEASPRLGGLGVAPGIGPVSYADAVEIAAPAVVNIHSLITVVENTNPLFNDPFFQRFFGNAFGMPRKSQQSSLGSGVIVSHDGYILTNNHVIEGAEAIQVGLRDGRNAAATVVGTDPESDLAVLKVELDGLPSITLGHSEKLRVGDVVMAIGNPFGVGQTVTLGIVSATGRSQLGLNTFEDFIQTDAAINPGNSGGALIDAKGQVVAINTAIFSKSGGSQGIGFAIPMSMAKGIMSQIIEHGRVLRGWLGVEVQELTPQLAESFGIDHTDGILIAGVLRDGPADRAGLQPGDIITHLDDEAVTSARQALDAITRTAPGDEVALRGLRDGVKLEINAEVAERPGQME